MTPPYFHDGSVATLPEAVRVMRRVQLGRKLNDEQVERIVAFLQSLIGSLPEGFATAPVLPAAPFTVSRTPRLGKRGHDLLRHVDPDGGYPAV